jgi:hypothetical protein
MTISNTSDFVSSIMFDIEHQMNTDLFLPDRWGGGVAVTIVLKCGVFIKLVKLQLGGSVLPFPITISIVQEHGMVVVPWYFETILEPGCGIEGPEFRLVFRNSL